MNGDTGPRSGISDERLTELVGYLELLVGANLRGAQMHPVQQPAIFLGDPLEIFLICTELRGRRDAATTVGVDSHITNEPAERGN